LKSSTKLYHSERSEEPAVRRQYGQRRQTAGSSTATPFRNDKLR
jgi:hypothetical protein